MRDYGEEVGPAFGFGASVLHNDHRPQEVLGFALLKPAYSTIGLITGL